MGAESLQGQIHSLLEGFRKVVVSRLRVGWQSQAAKAEDPEQERNHRG